MINKLLDDHYRIENLPIEHILWQGKPQPPTHLIFRTREDPYYTYTAYGYAFIGFSLFILFYGPMTIAVIGFCIGIVLLFLPVLIQKNHVENTIYYLVNEGVYIQFQTKFFTKKELFIPFSEVVNTFTHYAPNQPNGRKDVEIRTKELLMPKVYNFVTRKYETYPTFLFVDDSKNVSAIIRKYMPNNIRTINGRKGE